MFLKRNNNSMNNSRQIKTKNLNKSFLNEKCSYNEEKETNKSLNLQKST